MAVKVYDTETYEYADAAGLEVRDGHLFVVDGKGSGPTHSLAVYPPGKWERAEIAK